MMPAANQGVGMNMGFPDVCLTPAAPAPIPVPYPNIGMNAMSMPFVPNVMVSMAPAQNMGSKPLMTNGDNAGVAHPLCMQPGGTIMGNPRILIGGMPASHLCVPTQGNNFNNPVGSKLVPSVTNVLLGFRGGSVQSTPARAQVEDVGRVLSSPLPKLQIIDCAKLVQRIPIVCFQMGLRLEQILQSGKRLGMRALVLDLRGCRGGVVREAAYAALVLRSAVQRGLQLTMLIDSATASAAELLVADLQDRAAALVVGTKSFGKSKAWWGDQLCGAPSNPAVVFTRSSGEPIDGVGVTPDKALDPESVDEWICNGEGR
jgi:carboxyl-terminal processing protease